MEPIVSTEELARKLGQERLRVLDCRFYLDPAKSAREAYARGHLPSASFVDVEQDLTGPGGARGGPLGRHPWPSPERVELTMSRLGIESGVSVVAYDDQAGAVAARLWYLLRVHGHLDVAVLDGGLAKWIAEGRPLSTEEPSGSPARFQARLIPGRVLSKADLLSERPALVLDARAAERYRGETEPIDPRAGHIPGAKSAPYSGNLSLGLTPVFLSSEALRQLYEALGAGPTEPVVYCGSGITACHDLLALELAGLAGRLYSGSWSEWSSDPSLPVATGSE